MVAWDDFSSKYTEAVTTTLPIHRMILLLTGFTGVIVVEKQTHLSIAETLSSLNLAALFEKDSILLKNATILNLICGVALVFIAWAVSRILIKIQFSLAKRGTNLSRRVNALLSETNDLRSMSMSERQDEIAILEKYIESPKEKLKRINNLCEVSSGFGVFFMLAFIKGNLLDIFLGVIGLIVAIASSTISVRIFFKEYYGAALFISHLQGRSHPTPP